MKKTQSHPNWIGNMFPGGLDLRCVSQVSIGYSYPQLLSIVINQLKSRTARYDRVPEYDERRWWYYLEMYISPHETRRRHPSNDKTTQRTTTPTTPTHNKSRDTHVIAGAQITSGYRIIQLPAFDRCDLYTNDECGDGNTLSQLQPSGVQKRT